VLVAEDNDIAARVITALLEREGLDVVRARDGEEALRTASKGGFRLALIDLRMPLLDGLAFTHAFREGEPQVERLPIVALTADAAQDVRERCLAAGMDEFLTKPIAPDQLSAVVRRWVTGERAPAA
jgi:two-component system sensor histidine kinase RpfC